MSPQMLRQLTEGRVRNISSGASVVSSLANELKAGTTQRATSSGLSVTESKPALSATRVASEALTKSTLAQPSKENELPSQQVDMQEEISQEAEPKHTPLETRVCLNSHPYNLI